MSRELFGKCRQPASCRLACEGVLNLIITIEMPFGRRYRGQKNACRDVAGEVLAAALMRKPLGQSRKVMGIAHGCTRSYT